MSKALPLYICTALIVGVASLCFTGKTTVSYPEVRSNFTEQLFKTHQSIMTHDAYMAFIERYLKEAESKLAVHQYLMENPNCSGCANYFNQLFNYNVAYLNAYAKTYSTAQQAVERSQADLEQAIERIKLDAQLPIDVQKELALTKKIYQRACRHSYKKIGIGARIFNFFRTIGK